jgi:hypothetical protein
MSAVVRAACRLFGRGLTPMAARAKRPLAKSWQTLEPRDHLARLELEPPEQIGLRMGAQRDGRLLIALDVDGIEGEDSLERLGAELGTLPSTLEQRTPRGGRHLVFEWPRELASQCPTTSANKLGPRIDIRGQNGHIVAAPSPGAEGGQYELVDDEAPIELLPDAWAQRVIETHAPSRPAAPPSHTRSTGNRADAVERCRLYVQKMDPAVSGSGGHQATWRVAQVCVRGFGLGRDDAMEIMREYNQRCAPPWSDRELEHKVDSAETRSRMPRGCLLEEGRTRRWDTTWDNQPEQAAEAANPRHLRAVQPGEQASTVFNDEFCLAQRFYEPIAEVPIAEKPKKETWWLPILPDPPAHQRDIANNGVAEFVREYLEHHLPGRVLFDRETLWIYAAGCWREVPNDWLEDVVSRFHQKVTRVDAERGKQYWDANVGNIKSVIALLRLKMTHDQHFENVTGGGILDRSPCLAVFGSESIYMRGGKPRVRKSGPNLRARFAYPFEYSEGLEPANLLRVMRLDWFRGVEETEREKRIQCLREFVGHCLLGSLPLANIHKMLICVGSGNDGKSVLMNIVRGCMPPGSCSSINLQSLESGACGGEFNRAALEGKMANLIDDMSAATITESAAFKSAVTFAPIEARQIRGKAFSFTPRAAWWGNMNPTHGKLPKLEGQSGGMMRRLLCLEFPNSVGPGKETRDLADRILGNEMREVVCWAVESALDMLIEGRTTFTTPECHQRILDIWKSGSLGDDPVSDFVRHACRRVENESDWSVAQSELYPQFLAWVQAMGGSALVRDRAKCPFPTFMKRLRSAGVVVERRMRMGKQVRVANVRVQDEHDH